MRMSGILSERSPMSIGLAVVAASAIAATAVGHYRIGALEQSVDATASELRHTIETKTSETKLLLDQQQVAREKHEAVDHAYDLRLQRIEDSLVDIKSSLLELRADARGARLREKRP